MARLDVDDAEPPDAERDAVCQVRAAVVGTSVRHQSVIQSSEPGSMTGRGSPADLDDSADPAHASAQLSHGVVSCPAPEHGAQTRPSRRGQADLRRPSRDPLPRTDLDTRASARERRVDGLDHPHDLEADRRRRPWVGTRANGVAEVSELEQERLGGVDLGDTMSPVRYVSRYSPNVSGSGSCTPESKMRSGSLDVSS